MSTIKIEFESEDNAVVTAVAALTNSLLGLRAAKTPNVTPADLGLERAKTIEVVDAEEVKPDLLPKSGKPRPSRAKAKPAAVEEEIQDEEVEDEAPAQDDDLEDEAEEEAITIEDVRAKQAEKIAKHKPAIIEALGKFDAKGISSLDAKHYAAYYDILVKLK